MISNAADLTDSPEAAAALDAIEAGIAAARPDAVVGERLSLDEDASERGVLHVDGARYDLSAYDRIVVLGGGKAAAHVAAALEALLGDRIDEGVVVTDDPTPTRVVRVVEGSHPVPDERALEGAAEVLDLAERADESTLVLGVLTGGGSALLPAPAGDVTLADLQTLTDELLVSGAPIEEINAVRKHVSRIKGGRLARAAAPATVVGLLFSDVAGDDPGVIASGPLSPDPTTYGDARGVIEERGVDAPASVAGLVRAGEAGDAPESPAPGDPAFERCSLHVLANGFTALAAAAERLAAAGYEPLILTSSLRGEAQEAARSHVAIAEECLATGNPVDPPAAILSGGETTVTVGGNGDGDGEGATGTGGPNQEFALSAALGLPGGVRLASVDTDGIDGPTESAGALVTRETATPAGAARAALAANDVHGFLAERGALIDTGQTGTNVNDLRVVVVPGDAGDG
jgi:hydroxypyruvate reductase